MMCNNFVRTQYEDISIEFPIATIVDARYRETGGEILESDHELTRALPPIRTREDYDNDFRNELLINPDDRKLEPEIRRHLVTQLNEYRISRTFGYLVDMQIADALRIGYRLSVKKDPNKRYENDDYNLFYKKEGKTTAFALIGPSGTGKTTTLRKSLEYYPQVISHVINSNRVNQIVYIKVECPPAGSMATFYNSCLNELEKALDYKIPDRHRYKTIDAKEQLFKDCADKWNLGLLVIDEIQNLLSIKNKTLMNQFLTLANDLSVPMVFIGTDIVKGFFRDSQFFTQRRIGSEIDATLFKPDFFWDDLMDNIWKYQWMREYVPLTQAMKNRFYFETAGIIDRVVSLFICAQSEAIRRGIDDKEFFDEKLIEEVSKSMFSSSRDKVNALAIENINKQNALESFKKISSSGLFEITKDIENEIDKNTEFLIKKQSTNPEQIKSYYRKDIFDKIVVACVATNIAYDVEDIRTAVDKALNDFSGEDKDTIMKKAFNLFISNESQDEVKKEQKQSAKKRGRRSKQDATLVADLENLPCFQGV